MSANKLKILFVNTASSKTHMEDMQELFKMSYMGPLRETGQADFESLWVGPCVDLITPNIDVAVFNKCIEYRPDVLFIHGWWRYFSNDLDVKHISLSTFYLIRKLLNIKIVALIFDQDSNAFSISDQLLRFCDFVFTHEHTEHYFYYSVFPERHVETIATCSPKLFHGNPYSQRSVDIAIIGGLHKNRIKAVKELKESGLNITIFGGRGEGQKRLSNEEYAKIFHQSKIIINWSKHIVGSWYQAKLRIFETLLAGAMLLCEECIAVNKWLEPCIDYVPFWTTEELIEQAKYYLEHKQEQFQIAIQGNKTAMAKYTANIIWGQMVDVMQNESFYNESDAIEGLIRNASLNESYLMHCFKKTLHYPIIDRIIAILEKGLDLQKQGVYA